MLCLLNPKLYSEYAAAIPTIFGFDTIARNKKSLYDIFQ
jgi:hypothetical protein